MRSLLLLVLLPVVAEAQALDPAAQRIGAYHAAIQATLAETARATPARRAAAFEPVVREYYDVAAAMPLVVGRAWATASAADRAAATIALARRSAVSHAVNFAGTRAKFTVEPRAIPRGGDMVVRGAIGGTPFAYRMRQTTGRWRIVDVVAAGVSQLAVQRADFASTIAVGGVPALTKRLGELDRKATG